MTYKRRNCRIAAMKALFALETHKGKNSEKIFEYILNNSEEKNIDDSFARDIFKGVIKRKKKIRDMIKEFAPAWPVEKIAPVDRAILEIGIYEIMFSKEVPPIVAINEAIEIAKEYGDVNSSKFINGVLSSVMTKYCKRDPKTGAPINK